MKDATGRIVWSRDWNRKPNLVGQMHNTNACAIIPCTFMVLCTFGE